jgi:hypothetical protein
VTVAGEGVDGGVVEACGLTVADGRRACYGVLEWRSPLVSLPTHALTNAVLDQLLTEQLVVAWAGEAGDPARLKWWRTDLASEFGGEDLFKQLLPHTWRWAVLEGAREAALRHDADMRSKDAEADRLITLFHLGFTTDEYLAGRLADLKRAGRAPEEALPGLREPLSSWSSSSFADWVSGHGTVDIVTAPAGRRIVGDVPQSPTLLVQKLIAALHPVRDAYPLPHFVGVVRGDADAKKG